MRYLLLIFLTFSLLSALNGQEIVEVVHIEKDDGLKDRTVDRIIRDQNGYFFLFMLNTIQRYDGNSFETIDASALKTSKYKVRDVENIQLLSDGTITLHIPQSDILFYIPNKKNRVNVMPVNGRTLVNQGKLYLLKPIDLQKSDEFRIHTMSLSANSITAQIHDIEITKDVSQIGIENDIIYLQKEDHSVQIIRNDSLINLAIKGKLIQRDDGVYLFGRDKIYKLNGNQITEVANLRTEYAFCKILKLDDHQNIIASYSNRVRFQDNVYVLDGMNSLHDMSNIVGVTNVFKDFHTDNAFHRWMLGGYNGLHVVNVLRDGAAIIHKRIETKKSEFGMVISGVATNGADEVIFTRELKEVYAYDKSSNTFAEVMKDATSKGNFARNSKIYYHKPSQKYFSHAYRYDGQSDIYLTDLSTESFQKFTIPYKLNDILAINKDEILFGGFISKTQKGILGIYNIQSQAYKIVKDDTKEIRSITFDEPSKTFWVGTYAGLYVLDIDFNPLHRYDRNQSAQNFMGQDHIIMTTRFNDWMMAMSYGGGVYVIDTKTMEIIKKIDESNGLTDNSAIGAVNDDLGNCWVTTFNGISVIDSNLQVIRKIYEHEGLPNREFNSKAIAKDGDGNIYAGTLNGVAMLNPQKVLNWQKSCHLNIQSIIGFKGKNFERLEVDSEIPLYESYDSLVINYNLPDYHYYPYVEEVIVLDVQGNMDYSHEKGKVTLKNFKAGDYKVILSLSNQYEKTVLNIKRQSNVRRTVSILFIALVIGLFAWLISKQIIKSNKIREAEKTKLNKKIADLQLSSLQSQMNPHFIFNALGSIQYFIQTYDTVKADEFLSNFAMLMRSILESSKSKYISLTEEIKLLKLYMGLEKVRFENLFDFKVIIDESLDLESKIPPMILQPFVENAINHGLYHLKNRKGRLRLRFEYISPTTIQITITDNGIGRAAASKLRTKNHKSRGMQIVNERLQTINDSQDMKVDVETKDVEEDGIPWGTEIVLTISELG